MDPQLTFVIKNQMIYRTDEFGPVQLSRNYLRAGFKFLTEEWDGIIATALFKSSKKELPVIIGTDGTCLVPWEVLTDNGEVSVTVFGGDLITANQATVEVLGSGYSKDTDQELEPSPSLFEQMMLAFQNAMDACSSSVEDARQSAEAAAEALLQVRGLNIDGGTFGDWKGGEE